MSAAPPPAEVSDSTRLSFTRDDFDAAVERARSAGKLLFVDAWAEWCHTCLSMEAVVLSDASLRPFASTFEFVALDTEKPGNAGFVDRFAMDTWPTFFVIRPQDLALIGFWPGAGSVREMRTFLEQSMDAAAEMSGGDAPLYLREFLAARQADSAGQEAAAAKAYQAAYTAMPAGWARRDELLFGYMRSLLKLQRFEDCAALGKKHLDEIRGAALPAQFAQRYFTCLGQLRSATRTAEVERAIAKLEALAHSPNDDMAFDDQVDALSILATAYTQLGRTAEAKATLRTKLQIAETAAAKAKEPLEAQAFDRLRVSAYLDAGKADEALRLLEQRESELPHGYAAPSLRADVLYALKRYDEALQALQRAENNAEGPRRAEYLETRSAWLRALGRPADELASVERLIALRSGLRGQSNQQKLQQAEQRRATLRAALNR